MPPDNLALHIRFSIHSDLFGKSWFIFYNLSVIYVCALALCFARRVKMFRLKSQIDEV